MVDRSTGKCFGCTEKVRCGGCQYIFFLFFTFILIKCVCVCTRARSHAHVCIPQCTHRSQGLVVSISFLQNGGNWGLELRLSGLRPMRNAPLPTVYLVLVLVLGLEPGSQGWNQGLIHTRQAHCTPEPCPSHSLLHYL